MHRIAAITVVALALGAVPSEARQFVRTVDNPWFPLRSGSVWRYRGVKDGKPSRDVVRVTGVRKRIQGVTTTAVSDRLYLAGRLEERTTDWYAQDAAGNVWYFGENTAELDRHGHVKTREGSWQAGVNGAKPGIFMPAHPHPGQTGRQEFLKGHAEDHFRVLKRTRTTLLTEEWTPLEPGVLDHKHYRRGVGTVLEVTVRGGNERNALVSFKRGS
ncbi:MAG TPA: hypothetical protein VF032_22060 [Thermoleophilaceae bacterium]